MDPVWHLLGSRHFAALQQRSFNNAVDRVSAVCSFELLILGCTTAVHMRGHVAGGEEGLVRTERDAYIEAVFVS